MTALRLSILSLLLFLGALSQAWADDGWAAYKQRFLAPEGRIVDRDNGGISHSEGQGYGMLLAAANDDRASFDRLWTWTRRTLQRDDHLFSWKYLPGKPDHAEAVPDPNDASDGDLLIAWALARAAERWQVPAHAAAAREIAAAIAAHLVVRKDGQALLLPGLHGFQDGDRVTVNLSYWIFPAFDTLYRLTGDGVWPDLIASGKALIASARFGRWHLPPDWLTLDGAAKPAKGFPPRYGYDAVRIPLYLTWGHAGDPATLQPFADFARFFQAAPFLPAWTNLTDDSVDSHGASPGMRAVYALAQAGAAGQALPADTNSAIGSEDGYYSSSLLLLARIAATEGQ